MSFFHNFRFYNFDIFVLECHQPSRHNMVDSDYWQRPMSNSNSSQLHLSRVLMQVNSSVCSSRHQRQFMRRSPRSVMRYQRTELQQITVKLLVALTDLMTSMTYQFSLSIGTKILPVYWPKIWGAPYTQMWLVDTFRYLQY